MITIQNLCFSYENSAITLFNNFSIQLSSDNLTTSNWTCIAGANGTGKSTLLYLVLGKLKPQNGFIRIPEIKNKSDTINQSCDVIYCEQNCRELPENVYSAFWDSDNLVRQFFSILDIQEEQFERWDTLSGGEKKRIQIAAALALQPKVLLLDEPTNHLDENSKEKILSALKLFSGDGIIVSHDRCFSDSLCNNTLYLYRESAEIHDGEDCIKGCLYSGGLSHTLEIRQSEKESSKKQWSAGNLQVTKSKQLSDKWAREAEHSAARLKKGSVIDKKDHDSKRRIDVARVAGKDRIAGDTKRRFDTRVNQAENTLSSLEKPLSRKSGFSISVGENDAYVSENIVTLSEQELHCGKYNLCIPNLCVKRNSRIALTGENGTGKTFLIKSLLENSKDRIEKIFYLPQEISKEEENKVFQEYNELDESDKGDVLSTLYRLGSEPESLLFDNQSISPGELRKLIISMAVNKSKSSQILLFILDEPTNHMDIVSTKALEEALAELPIALIVISHDSMFLQNIRCNENWHLSRKGNFGKLKIEVKN